MNNLRQQAEELLILGAIRATINAEYGRRLGQLHAEYDELGLERQKIASHDGDVGSIVLAAAAVDVEVNNHAAMVEWLQERHPGEISIRPTIQPAYLRRLVDIAKKTGVAVDPETGEVIEWLTVTVRERTLRATPTSDAKRRVKDLISRAGLNLELEV